MHHYIISDSGSYSAQSIQAFYPMDLRYEDDVLYMELRRQILLLTADQDDNENNLVHKRHSNSISTLKPGSYFNWWASTNSDSVPTWLVNLWRNGSGNGTGVFIPHIVRSRRQRVGQCSGKI